MSENYWPEIDEVLQATPNSNNAKEMTEYLWQIWRAYWDGDTMNNVAGADLQHAMRMAATATEIRIKKEAEAKAEEPHCAICGYGEASHRTLHLYEKSGHSQWICGLCVGRIKAWLKPDEFDQAVAEAPLNALKAQVKALEKRLAAVESLNPGRVATRMVTAFGVAEQDIVTSLHKVKDALRGEAREGASVEELAARKYFDSRKALTGQELCGDCGFRMAAIEGSPLCRDYNKRTLDDICGYLTMGQSSRWVPKVAAREEGPSTPERRRSCVNCGDSTCAVQRSLKEEGKGYSTKHNTYPCGSWAEPSKEEEPEENPDILRTEIDLAKVRELFDGGLEGHTTKDINRWHAINIQNTSVYPTQLNAKTLLASEADNIFRTCPGLNAIVWFDAPTGRPVTKVTPRGLGMEEK
jgi:hypothetical protein